MKPSKPLKRSPVRKKSARRHLVQEADRLVREVVLQEQGEACLKCHQVKPLHAAHILPKGAYPSLRFETTNVIGLCMRDHLYWAHRDPVGFVDWVNQIFPGRIDRLKLSASQHRKIDLKELICVLKSLVRDPPGTPQPRSEDLNSEPF